MKANWRGKGRKTAGRREEGGKGEMAIGHSRWRETCKPFTGHAMSSSVRFFTFCLFFILSFFEGRDGQSTRGEACKPSTGHATSSSNRSREENKQILEMLKYSQSSFPFVHYIKDHCNHWSALGMCISTRCSFASKPP